MTRRVIGLVLLGLVSVPASVEAQQPWVMWEGFVALMGAPNEVGVPADWKYWTPVLEFVALKDSQSAISAHVATLKNKEASTSGEPMMAVGSSSVRTWSGEGAKQFVSYREWRCFPAGFVPGSRAVK